MFYRYNAAQITPVPVSMPYGWTMSDMYHAYMSLFNEYHLFKNSVEDLIQRNHLR